MRRLGIPGGQYCAAWPDGGYAATVPGQYVETHAGHIPLPPGEDTLLGVRAFYWAPVDSERPERFYIAGVGHNTGLAWLWDGDAWKARGTAHGGQGGAVFDPRGALLVTLPTTVEGGSRQVVRWPLESGVPTVEECFTGATGIRWVDLDGTIHPAFESYADPARHLYEWTQCDGFRVGQGGAGGAVVQFDDEPLVSRLIEPGNTQFIVVEQAGPDVGIGLWRMDTNESVLIWATVDDLRALPAVTDPVMIPPIGRKVLVGPFFRDHNIFPYAMATTPPLGRRPETAATVSVIVDPYGYPADPTPDGVRPKTIISPECLWMAAHYTHDWWSDIIGVYVAREGTEHEWVMSAEAAAAVMEELQLPPWPFVSYTADHIYPDMGSAEDIIGVEVYPQYKTGSETPDQMLVRGRTRLAQVAHRRVAIIAAAYTRNGLWTGRVSSLFPIYAQLAREFPNVEMVLGFSDARKFGMRWLQQNGEPDIFAWWTALVEAGR